MKLFILIPLIVLSGCAMFTKEVPRNVPVFSKVVCPQFRPIPGIEVLPFVFVEAIDVEGKKVLGLSGKDYSAMAINSSRTLEYIIIQKEAIRYYEECIKNHNSIQKEGSP